MGGISKLNPCYQKATGRIQRLHALCFCALTAALTAVSTSAQDVKERMAAALSGFAGQSIAVETVRTSPAPGIVEVQIENGPLLYAAADGSYFFLNGDLHQTTASSAINLTEQRRSLARKEQLLQ